MIHIYQDHNDPNRIVIDNPRRVTTISADEAESLIERLATILIEVRHL